MTSIVTLVTGGNRGMGLELVKELSEAGQKVILGSRNLTKGQEAIEQLNNKEVDLVQLDVTDDTSIQKAVAELEKKYSHLDILINNAGAVFDNRQKPSEINQTNLRADFDLNYFGTIAVTQAFLPLLKKAPQAKIINISSMMGSITNALDPNSEVYKASAVGYQSSKAALNMYTVQLAKELRTGITVNAVDPGMVATEFGGVTPEFAQSLGAKTPALGVARTIELASNFQNSDTGTFSNTKGKVAW